MEQSVVYYILVFVIAYLFGSFPSAYLLIKIFRKQDIRSIGSGNVGTLNALRAGKSKPIAVVVLLLDVFKGWLPAYLVVQYMSTDFLLLMAVVLGVLFGHILPVWLHFQGGRGLAVTAGALLLVDPLLVAVWVILWVIFFTLLRKHIIANMIAIFLMPIIVYFGQGTWFAPQVLLIVLPVCLIIFLKHLERLPGHIPDPTR